MKIIRGRKSGLDCVVKLDNASYRTKLSLEKSLEIAKHSPDGFQWGYSGSGPAQLAAAILYEITDDVELSRTYYELFKHDHVSQWNDTFEISEFEVRIWLSLVGAEIEPPAQQSITI